MNKEYKLFFAGLFSLCILMNFSFSKAAQESNASDKPKLYEGMPKEEIYKVYPQKYQIQDYAKDNLEVVIFDDYLTETAGDTITFYLKGGKVSWWDKVQASPTPEENLQAILNRNKHKQEDSSMNQNGNNTIIKIKDKQHLDDAGYDRTKTYFKEKQYSQ
ncbi:MAG: hypothetical protein WC546_04835 [Candidatus Omnitrophota bacterium]